MTALLTIIVLISIAVAIWQMVKIFDLANAGKETSPVATDKDNSWNAYFMLGFLIFIYVKYFARQFFNLISSSKCF